MDHAGAMVGPLVASGLLALGWPLRHVFAAALIPGLCSLIAVAVVNEPASTAATPPLARQARSERLPRPLLRYLGVVALFALGNSSDAFLLLRARELGLSVAALPALWSLFHVAKMLSSYFGGEWSDRIGRARAIIWGWALYAATYLGFGFAEHAWQIWALFVIYGCHYGLTEPAERALVKQLAPAHLHGRAYGAYHFVVGIMAVPAGVLTGWLWQTLSPLSALAAGASLAALASAVFALSLGRSSGG
jgi:MFS family permease